MKTRIWVGCSVSAHKTWGAIHSTKISGNFGPKLNGSVRSNRKSFEKNWSTFSRPLFPVGPVGILVEWIAPLGDFRFYHLRVGRALLLQIQNGVSQLSHHASVKSVRVFIPRRSNFRPYRLKMSPRFWRSNLERLGV